MNPPWFIVKLLCLVVAWSFLLSSKAAASPPHDKSPGECFATTADFSSYYCKPSRNNQGVPCVDSNEDCPNWAKEGECKKNPVFMLVHCQKSCSSCLSIHIGETQIAPHDDWRQAVHRRLIETQAYMHQEIQHHFRYLETCKNKHELCTLWAVQGKCETDPQLLKDCAPACRSCDKL